MSYPFRPSQMHSSRTAPKTLTDGEVRLVLEATSRDERDLRDHVLILVTVSTGLRVSEVTALDVGQVRSGHGIRAIVELRAAATKGKRGGEVVLPEQVRAKLALYLAWKAARGESVEAGAPLFVSRGGGRAGAKRGARLSRRSAEHLFRLWQERAGFDRAINFHALRQTFATTMLRKTGNLRLVQIACRHASPQTTSVYTHPSMEDRVAAAAAMGW